MKNARTLAVHIVAPWPISASTGAPGMDEARPLLGGGVGGVCAGSRLRARCRAPQTGASDAGP